MVTKNEVCSLFLSTKRIGRIFFLFSSYCHILQYNEDEIKTLDDVRFVSCFFSSVLSKIKLTFLSFLNDSFVKIVFDIEQLNFDDTNKFPDWRITVDTELERFRAQ